jgi:hypothetical protein
MLPKIDVPIYELKLISNEKKIKFRPFTVKEEKLFLMAMESNDPDSSVNTIKQVLNNCIIDEINLELLPIFDLEYLFVHLRAKSIGEEVKLRYRCNNQVQKEDKIESCNNLVEMNFNLLEIQPTKNEKHTNRIEIENNLGVVFKYPNFETLQKYGNNSNDEIESILKLIIDCIDYIYDADQIYYAKDSSELELREFIESLQTNQLEKIKVFFDTMPKLQKTLNFKCNKCNYEEEINLEGIQNFFV